MSMYICIYVFVFIYIERERDNIIIVFIIIEGALFSLKVEKPTSESLLGGSWDLVGRAP